MELSLNLAWLLLALPAYWLWRRSEISASQGRSLGSWQGLLVMGCVLVVLFPVVSATDDLRAMRAEMEEPGISKRSVRQTSQDRSSVKVSAPHNPPAILENVSAFALSCDSWHESDTISSSPFTARSILRAGRAPPVFLVS